MLLPEFDVPAVVPADGAFFVPDDWGGLLLFDDADAEEDEDEDNDDGMFSEVVVGLDDG